MNRRSLLALIVALLVMPLVRFAEALRSPRFRQVIRKGVLHSYSSVRVFIDGVEFTEVGEVEFTWR